MKKYKTIVADPPWPYTGRGPASSREHRPNSYGAAPSSVERYGSMSIADLKKLLPQTEDKAHLYLWTTNSFICQAHEIASAWGFDVKTIITWGKIKSDNTASMKTGYYFRGATEHCLFATKGNLRLKTSKAYPSLFLSERLPHSVKPEWFYGLVEAVSYGDYLELFARNKRTGWDCFGNQVQSDYELKAGALHYSLQQTHGGSVCSQTSPKLPSTATSPC